MNTTNPTAYEMISALAKIRRQYAHWIVLTNDLEGEEQREARCRADEIKADIVSAESLVKTGHSLEAYRFLKGRG
jgi:hypothetical protein